MESYKKLEDTACALRLYLLAFVLLTTACGGGSSEADGSDENTAAGPTGEAIAVSPDASGTQDDEVNLDEGDLASNDNPSPLDAQLSQIIESFSWDLNPLVGRDLPNIEAPLSQLGKKLFFSKSLGGDFDSACASCHHPTLGGADALSLPVGVGATEPNLIGIGREHMDGAPLVPRNSPTVLNAGLWDVGMFFDSRVESLSAQEGTNGSLTDIRTPDSDFGESDNNAGPNLVAAQARFPVTSIEEMRSENFENGSDNASVRDHLAARIGNYGVGVDELERNQWLVEFRTAFGSVQDAQTLITFDNIALALGEYQRSMVFVDTPWQNYIDGDLAALSDQQKQGAILFFTNVNQGGAGCANCHNGPLFSDSQHHTVAFPQIGPGKGDTNNDDFGRERETGNSEDRYRFRTPSLLNIVQTAPYGHTGAYANLRDVIRHYVNPRGAIDDFFGQGGWCQLQQFEDIDNCENLYPYAQTNSERALDKLGDERRSNTSLFQSPNLNPQETDQLVAFLQALSDPCIIDRACVAPWIADPLNDNPDDHVLDAVDNQGNRL